MNKRLAIFITSLLVAVAAVLGLMQTSGSSTVINVTYAILAIFFLGILVSNQQYEEDIFSKVERNVSAALFSYIVFFHFCYASLNQFFFGTLITQTSFFADLLALFLFAIFLFLFGTTYLVISRFARVGLFSSWSFFNNVVMFFILRILFIPAVGIFVLFFKWK
jgi:hypothetical protein